MLPAILTTLDTMQPIGLDEMKSVRLMNRMDQKYMASIDQLVPLLENIADGYYIQHIAPSTPDHNNSATQLSKFVQPYHTLYFDTDGLEMYTMHHNQKLNRQKLRVRTYRSTNTTFFEIKNKDNKKKTRKVRIPIDVAQFDHVDEVPEVRDFVDNNTPYTFTSHLSPFTLHPCLENSFNRITLVDKGMSERVTIDSGIRFHNRATGIDASTGKLMVIEVKHEVGAPMSAIEQALHEMHILPRRMSKYCIGTALTTPSIKHNRFKPKLLFIEKIDKS